MRLHGGTVDEDLNWRATRAGERMEQIAPDAFGSPADIAVVERLARAVVDRGVDPASARLQNMDDAADHPAIVDARLASRVGRQMRRNLRELRVRQPELVSIHQGSPAGNRESQTNLYAKRYCGPGPNLGCALQVL